MQILQSYARTLLLTENLVEKMFEIVPPWFRASV